MRAAALAVVLATAPGCAALAGALPAVVEVLDLAARVARAVDLAEAGARTHYARHPHPSEVDVAVAVRAVRDALVALDTVRPGDRTGRTLAGVRAAYLALLAELRAAGVLGAPHPGGAETGAPLPDPLMLPSWETLSGA